MLKIIPIILLITLFSCGEANVSKESEDTLANSWTVTIETLDDESYPNNPDIKKDIQNASTSFTKK